MTYSIKSVISILFLTVMVLQGMCQSFQMTPGFSKEEYAELLRVSTRQSDSLYNPLLPAPRYFERKYRSSTLGLDNRWELWVSSDSIAAISIRGTTLKLESWVENFFAAMLPAEGTLTMSQEAIYPYKLSNDKRASVHAGWLIGSVSIFQDLLPRIDSCMAEGIHDFYIVGHSQGGAIAYLLTSLLHHLKQDQPKYDSIAIKTYASAAPKPGNLYYAYEFEALTRAGWAFNVVNSADWVPEGPFSIQTTDDYNTLNPFKYADEAISNLSFPKNIVLKHFYNKLDKPTKKARDRFNKHLGEHMVKQVQRYLPNSSILTFNESSNYVRVGQTIVLFADEEYFKEFPNNDGEIWQHHKFEAYFYLLERLAL